MHEIDAAGGGRRRLESGGGEEEGGVKKSLGETRDGGKKRCEHGRYDPHSSYSTSSED
jgi:hypothetical protein